MIMHDFHISFLCGSLSPQLQRPLSLRAICVIECRETGIVHIVRITYDTIFPRLDDEGALSISKRVIIAFCISQIDRKKSEVQFLAIGLRYTVVFRIRFAGKILEIYEPAGKKKGQSL